MATEQPLDELDRRIRALEAERLRPVPPTPTAALDAMAPRIDAFLDALKRDYRHHRDEEEETA